MTDNENRAAENEKKRLLEARKKQRAAKDNEQDAPVDPGMERANAKATHGADRAQF